MGKGEVTSIIGHQLYMCLQIFFFFFLLLLLFFPIFFPMQDCNVNVVNANSLMVYTLVVYKLRS